MTEPESTMKTLLVAGGVALFCSLLVSTTVYWLRPFQLAQHSIEESRAILVAAGLSRADEALSDREIANRYVQIEPRIVDLDAGSYSGSIDAATYDYRAASDDPNLSGALASDRDIAGIGRRVRFMPVYLLHRGRELERMVLPVYGRGMWSTIYGFVGLGPDLTTVVAVDFFDHGETPGIGDRIQDPAWTAQWGGKRLYDAAGQPVLRVGAAAGDTDERVDAIAGATVTVSAIDRLVRFWFGADGYGPFLAATRAELP
jgi:Na+-transporting NADH:ubiquinone oxidoreductase subunit C